MDVPITELRDHLTEWLDRVAAAQRSSDVLTRQPSV
jgi:antitoxin (DNA-binding transcriptional repressor) of toxin-antitoxin stability system